MYDLSTLWLPEFIFHNRELITWVLIIVGGWLSAGILSTAMFRSSSDDDE